MFCVDMEVKLLIKMDLRHMNLMYYSWAVYECTYRKDRHSSNASHLHNASWLCGAISHFSFDPCSRTPGYK